MKPAIIFSALVGAFLLGGNAAAAATPALPRLASIGEATVVLAGNGGKLVPGNRAGDWTLMAVTTGAAGEPLAVFEDFSTPQGSLALVDGSGRAQILPKSLESTEADPARLYRGHSLAEVRASDHDLLGAEILAQAGDPKFDDVAACLAPITKFETYSFVGTPQNPDKIGAAYGGRTGNFDPAVFVPAIRQIRAEGRVGDGLVGGWLPALRFVYPEKPGDWSEMVMFAPWRKDNANPRVQPVWYRVCRVEGNELKWVKYFDSYVPFSPRADPTPAAPFYRDLLALRDGWGRTLAPGMQVELPDARLADQARHSLARAMITRVDGFPKYGVLDRNYGGAEHDGFQDTFNVDTTAMLGWGLFAQAREYIDNYFTYFVRDDGSILYRGPETGQYGRMLTVLAEYANYTGDDELLLKHRVRIDAVAQLLLGLRRTAQALPVEHPAYGMIAGWSEADSCLEAEPARYQQPYLSNSAEAARGFGDLGAVWERSGLRRQQPELAAHGRELRREGKELGVDLQVAVGRSLLTDTSPVCLPAIAGAKEPPHVAAARDGSDPQFRAYRAYMEMLFSGQLNRSTAETIVRYREAHRDIILGVPTAYGYNTGELAGFLSYGHGYGLLQHDFVREYLLELYSLSAHQYTRGNWTAPETRLIDPARNAAPYCVTAQLAVPLLVRWLLAWEDPNLEKLWLCRAAPQEWFEDGKTVAASGVPTRWGAVGFRITSHLAQNRIEAELVLPSPSAGQETRLRLRVPGGRAIEKVLLAGQPQPAFTVSGDTITIPAAFSGRLALTVHYR